MYILKYVHELQCTQGFLRHLRFYLSTFHFGVNWAILSLPSAGYNLSIFAFCPVFDYTLMVNYIKNFQATFTYNMMLFCMRNLGLYYLIG
jgi:hypothetical protein